MKDFPPGTRLRLDNGGELRVVRKTTYGAWYVVAGYDKGGEFLYRGIVTLSYLLSLQELRCPLREEEEEGG